MLKLISVDGEATDIVTLNQAKEHLRVDGTNDDTYITALLSAAVNYIEEETGRDFVSKTWEEVLNGFPSYKIELAKPPLDEITSITYVDENGDSQVLPTNKYESFSPHYMPGFIIPKGAYPQTASNNEGAVVIRYTTGSTHDLAKHAVKLLVAHWYENREAEIVGTISSPIKIAGLDRLCNLLAHGGYH